MRCVHKICIKVEKQKNKLTYFTIFLDKHETLEETQDTDMEHMLNIGSFKYFSHEFHLSLLMIETLKCVLYLL